MNLLRPALDNLAHDTRNGLVAFALPGGDPWSVAQGTSRSERGRCKPEAGASWLRPSTISCPVSGLLKFVGGSLLELAAFGSVNEWGVFGPATKQLTARPAGWALSGYSPNGEARWVKHLFIVGNSALPNGLGGPNQTLTSQALAIRTAEKIFHNCFGGHAWVGHESSVASIDDKVTMAVLRRGL